MGSLGEMVAVVLAVTTVVVALVLLLLQDTCEGNARSGLRPMALRTICSAVWSSSRRTRREDGESVGEGEEVSMVDVVVDVTVMVIVVVTEGDMLVDELQFELGGVGRANGLLLSEFLALSSKEKLP